MHYKSVSKFKAAKISNKIRTGHMWHGPRKFVCAGLFVSIFIAIITTPAPKEGGSLQGGGPKGAQDAHPVPVHLSGFVAMTPMVKPGIIVATLGASKPASMSCSETK